MTISTAGFEGSMTQEAWSRYQLARGRNAWHHGVYEGFNVSPTAGTREVTTSLGVAFAPGVLVESDAPTLTLFAANAGATNRTDYVVLRVDWIQKTATFAVLQGASATAPVLAKQAGVLWEIPLARVTIRPSVTSLVATDIQACKPIARDIEPFGGSNITSNTIAFNSAGVVISSVTIPDPGWPYFLQLEAGLRVSGDSGYGLGRIRVDGTVYATSYGALMTTVNGSQPLRVQGRSPLLSGQHVVDLMLSVEGAASGNPISNGAAAANYLTAYRIPK